MGKILKYLKKYWLWIVTALCLLVVQAYCDLSLPSYTSELVDTGIMQQGVESLAPKAISRGSMQTLQMFMTDEEKELVNGSYSLEKGISESDLPYKSGASEAELYVLKSDLDNESLESLDKAFGMPMMSLSGAMQMPDEAVAAMLTQGDPQGASLDQIAQSMGIEVKEGQKVNMLTFIASGKVSAADFRSSIEEKYADLSDMIVEQTGKAFVIGEYTSLGVDLDQLEKDYLFVTGGKMLAMALIIMLVSMAVCYIAAKIGAGVGLDLRIGVFKKVVKFSSAEMDKFSTASLITRSTNDIQQIKNDSVRSYYRNRRNYQGTQHKCPYDLDNRSCGRSNTGSGRDPNEGRNA